jgi:aryl-alcohol dehydrogenase-like predicted oxidoreductase
MPSLVTTGLDVAPLCLGTNVFGWTAGEAQAHAVLDAYADAGGDFIDTADSYSAWADGNQGGESEAIIGSWLAKHPERRDDLVIATKVSRLAPNTGLSRRAVLGAADASLRRLQTDRIDLYWAHFDDPDTPLEETLGAFGELLDAGKVRAIGASNYSGARLAEALEIAERDGLPRFTALQPHYNLVEREPYESELAPLVAEHDLAVVPYYALARGFLTGKYRPGGAAVDSPRAGAAAKYLDHGGASKLDALDAVAAAHGTTVAAVALAWLASRPHVAAPIASARDAGQLRDLLPVLELRLTDAELATLTDA